MKRTYWLIAFIAYYGCELLSSCSLGLAPALLMLMDNMCHGWGMLAFANWGLAAASYYCFYTIQETRLGKWLVLLTLFHLGWVAQEASLALIATGSIFVVVSLWQIYQSGPYVESHDLIPGEVEAA